MCFFANKNTCRIASAISGDSIKVDMPFLLKFMKARLSPKISISTGESYSSGGSNYPRSFLLPLARKMLSRQEYFDVHCNN